jgi:hypothetical protein
MAELRDQRIRIHRQVDAEQCACCPEGNAACEVEGSRERASSRGGGRRCGSDEQVEAGQRRGSAVPWSPSRDR